MPDTALNPAEIASVDCLNRVFEAMEINKNFLVEAGAGAGKTYTLIKALKKQIEKNGVLFQKTNRKIACITYTNVAKDEIRSRTDNNPVIFAETIHAFAWSLISDFQINLRPLISGLSENWAIRIEEIGGIGSQIVKYSLGFPKITETEIYLHHNDVISLFISLLEDPKFQLILTSRYPIIFIDEYQDTNKKLAESFIRNFIEQKGGPLFGFFGDHWQKIYGPESIGLISASADNLVVIGKEANFRSDRIIVEALNRMRPELIQHVKDPGSAGEITVFHTNTWNGERRADQPWTGDLPADTAHEYLNQVKAELGSRGWNLAPEYTKILMLTHNVLASEQGYKNILDAVGPDDLLKKNDDYVSFLINTVEPGSTAFVDRRYGLMLESFKLKAPSLRTHAEKVIWSDDVSRLVELRQTGTIGDVLDLLKHTRKPELPRRIIDKEKRLSDLLLVPEETREEADKLFVEKITKIRSTPYVELTNAAAYINDKTLFSTKHGVKGAEFENVLIVLGRGWNLYNWNQMLEWSVNGIPKGRQDSFERNRNLFYVACSRPKSRLALLFTQQLSDTALAALNGWFGNVIVPFPL